MVCYGVGSADEPPRRSGIAHFLEHLMFKGTKEVSGKEFSRLIAINGGRDNAFTSYDYTAYYQTIASDRLELVMRLEADRMVNLTLAPEDVQVEREVILEERRQRVENEPQALLSEALNAALYAGHPYGRPITGWPDEIAALSRDDALAFYHRYYAPNNAVLVVAGDVEPEKVHALAQKYFGSIPSQEVPDRVRPSPVRLHADNRIEMADPRVSTASWRRAYQVPDAESFGLDRADALQVFMTALGQGPTSYLYRRLVVEDKVATSAGAYYRANRDEGMVMLYATPAPGVSVEKMEAALNAALAQALAEGLDPAMIERAKTGLKAEAIYARDSIGDAARVIGGALITGESLDRVERWVERIESVDASTALEAARAVMQDVPSVTAILKPADGASAAAGSTEPPAVPNGEVIQ